MNKLVLSFLILVSLVAMPNAISAQQGSGWWCTTLTENRILVQRCYRNPRVCEIVRNRFIRENPNVRPTPTPCIHEN